MSRSLLRLLLAFALAFAVPLQGFAAAAGGVCKANGHGDGAGLHSHDGDAGHDHDGHAHCPPCVACCAAAAISASTPLFIADESTRAVDSAAPASLADVQPDQLDRPPLAAL